MVLSCLASLMHVKGVVVSENDKIFCLFRNGIKAYDYWGNYLYDVGGGSGSGDGQFNLNVHVFGDLSQGALLINQRLVCCTPWTEIIIEFRCLTKTEHLSKNLDLTEQVKVNLPIPKIWFFFLMAGCWSTANWGQLF